MVAMAATIAAVYPHMNHLGGDGFWLVRERSGRVRALMAAGRAGSDARRELYREHEAIPARGPLAALTVPGAIAGWSLALEAAKAQGGRLPLENLLAHAIRHAREGYVVTRSQARLSAEKLAELKDAPGFAQTFLVDGKPPAAGATLRQAALAATLDHLAHVGLDDFYRGDVGREIAGDLERIGSPVSRADLMQCRATAAEPLRVTLQSGTIYNTLPKASTMSTAWWRRPSAPSGCATASSPTPTACPPRRIASSSAASSTPRRTRSTAARPRRGRQSRATATPSGWGPPTVTASRSPISSRCTGSSAPAACCRRPAC
jgi:gamma-glutamyltranspeptidase/glutathione hydrolase